MEAFLKSLANPWTVTNLQKSLLPGQQVRPHLSRGLGNISHSAHQRSMQAGRKNRRYSYSIFLSFKLRVYALEEYPRSSAISRSGINSIRPSYSTTCIFCPGRRRKDSLTALGITA